MNLVRVKLDDGTEVSVGESFAKSHNLKVLDKPTTTRGGLPVRIKRPVDLRGKALNDALDGAGLSKAGTADEKRSRLEEHQEALNQTTVTPPATETSVAQSADGTNSNPAGSESASHQEDIA